MRVHRDDLLRRYVGTTGSSTVLLDCRTEPEYAGQRHHPLDLPVERHRALGHILGARQPASQLPLTADGRFRAQAELTELFVARGVQPDSDVAV